MYLTCMVAMSYEVLKNAKFHQMVGDLVNSVTRYSNSWKKIYQDFDYSNSLLGLKISGERRKEHVLW